MAEEIKKILIDSLCLGVYDSLMFCMPSCCEDSNDDKCELKVISWIGLQELFKEIFKDIEKGIEADSEKLTEREYCLLVDLSQKIKQRLVVE